MDAPHASLVGKTIVIGVTGIHEATGKRRTVQAHGTIIEVDPEAWIAIATEPDGAEFLLPPAFAFLSDAKPGSYRARSTGLVIVDPDLTTEWEATLEHEADLDAADWQRVWRAEGTWTAIARPATARDAPA